MKYLKIPVRYLCNWTIPEFSLQSPEDTISDFYHLKMSRLSQMHSQVPWIRFRRGAACSLEHDFSVLLVDFQRTGPHICTTGSGRILNKGCYPTASQLLSVLLEDIVNTPFCN